MLYAPELLPVPRYACDHAGVPRVLTDAEQGVWESLLARRTCRSTSTGRRPRSYRAGHRTCGVHALPLAEFAVYFAKGFPALRTWQRAHHWERYTTTLLTGPRVAVVGLCGIGREVVALFTALRTVLCCPLTPETRGLVGPRQLAKLPPHAVLINVARGGVVDESALVEALAAGELAGACLDVFATEPLPPDSPL